MHIKWNKVTWYSWVAAVVIFVGTFFLGLWLGKQTAIQQAGTAPSTIATSTDTDVLAVVTYACDGGKQIQATYLKDKVHVITNDGKDVIIPQTRSGSGIRYANSNETFVFWSKGNDAFITETKGTVSTTTYANCTQIAAPVE